MELKRVHQDFSVCQVKDYSFVNLSHNIVLLERLTKKNHLYALRVKFHRILSGAMMDGKPFVFKASWIFH